MAQKKSLILDLHIPYGITPIKYISGFQLMGANEEKNAYLMAMMREVMAYEGQLDDYEIRAVHLSGGAATVMKPDLLGQLLATVRKKLPVAAHAEVSFDALPNTIGTPSLSGISVGQPNRAELMMRSYRDEELRALQCPFELQHVKNAILFFDKFHLNNLGFTVNYGIPGQTLRNWEYTINACSRMRPSHITVLPLAVTDAEGMPDEEGRFEMFSRADALLREAGYLHYGSGLFCLPGHENMFEVLRANGCEILAMGLNGSSMLDGYYTRNTNNLRLYIRNAGNLEGQTAEAAQISADAAQMHYAAGRMTMEQGLSLESFEKRFGVPLPVSILSALEQAEELGLAESAEEGFVPTIRGLFKPDAIGKLISDARL